MLSGCSKESDVTPSGRTVKIGIIAPLTGPDSELGKSGLLGIEIVLKKQPLLENGDRVELVIRDDQSRPEKALEAFDLLADEEVTGILVLSQSNTALALAKRSGRHRIPLISTIASHPDLTLDNDHVIQVNLDDSFQATAAALFVRDERFLSKAAVFYEEHDAHSRMLANEFIKQFRKANGTITDRLEYSKAASTLSDHLVMLRDKGVQMIYLPVDAKAAIPIIQTARNLKWDPAMMAGDGMLSQILLQHPDDLGLIDGLMATDCFSTELTQTGFGQDLARIYRQQKSDRGTTLTILGSEGAGLLMEALNRCRPPYEAEDLQHALRNIKRFEGFAGILAIDKEGHAIRPVYINTIIGSKLEFIVKVY